MHEKSCTKHDWIFSTILNTGPGNILKTLVSNPLSGCVNETDFENGKRCTACKDGCVNAACLPTEREAGGRACWIAGWGITTEDFRDGPLTSKYLRKHFRKICAKFHMLRIL